MNGKVISAKGEGSGKSGARVKSSSIVPAESVSTMEKNVKDDNVLMADSSIDHVSAKL
jgi:hypothetical protein